MQLPTGKDWVQVDKPTWRTAVVKVFSKKFFHLLNRNVLVHFVLRKLPNTLVHVVMPVIAPVRVIKARNTCGVPSFFTKNASCKL